MEGVVSYRPDPVGVVGGPCSHGSLRGLADVPETHSTVVTGGSKLVLLVRVEINRPRWKMSALLIFIGPIGQSLKSAPQEDFFYVSILRYVSCFPSSQEGFLNVQ